MSWMFAASLTICWRPCNDVLKRIIAKCLQARSAAGGEVASIHDRVVFKQADLDKQLGYDRFPRKSMMDHFFDNEVTMDSLAMGEYRNEAISLSCPMKRRFAVAANAFNCKCDAMGTLGAIPFRSPKQSRWNRHRAI